MAILTIPKKIYDALVSVITGGRIDATIQEPLSIDDNGGSLTVDAVNLDIRDLTSASDSVEVLQDTFADLKTEVHNAAGEVLLTGAHGWDGGFWETLNTDTNNRLLVKVDVALPTGANAIGKLAANSGVDIGDVTINNAGAGAAVNVQDGGNSITVDGTFWQATQPVSGTFWQATQPVSATDLDIRDLTSASDSVEVLQDTFADCKVEAHAAAGEVLPMGSYVYDGATWETLNSDVPNSARVQSDENYAARNRTQVLIGDTKANGSHIIYTVPTGKTLYISSGSIAASNHDRDASGTGRFLVRIDSADVVIAEIDLGLADVDDTYRVVAMGLTFPMPIKLVAGETVNIESTTALVNTSVSFQGWIE